MSSLHTQQPDWPASLLSLLQKQHKMVDELVALAQTQAAFIANGSTDQLLNVLAKRQAVIDDFTASQEQLAEFTSALDERIEGVAIADRQQIKSLINEIGERLTQVMKRDEDDQAALCGSRDQIKHEMKSVGAAQKARSAYRPSDSRTTRYSDQHG